MSYTDTKRRAVLDVECWPNYFMVGVKCIETGRTKAFEMYEGHELDRAGLIRVLRNFCVVTFNGNTYDMPMVKLSLRQTSTNAKLKVVSDAIVNRNLKPWDCEREFNVPVVDWIDHIDMIEPAPSVQVGLKLYGGRLHSKRLQDLPLDPDALIRPEKRSVIVDYNTNDLDTTIDLYRHIEPQLNLRCQMSDMYGIDLRSKSDAQIAEAVIRHELERIKGDRIFKPEIPPNYSFYYEPPEFLRFRTEQMRAVAATVYAALFTLNHKKARCDENDVVLIHGVSVKVSGVKMPEEIKRLRVRIGNSIYRMGIGGLHSSEVRVSHYSDEEYIIRDADVASYYPAIVLNCELYPSHLGRDFLDVYRGIRERRIKAKKAGDKVTDMTLKIVLNGTFGKLGSKYSFLYSPNLMIQVTITGQLALLMLIESLELAGISVVSANTDGIVSKIPRHLEREYDRVVKEWEKRTGFDLEFADYASLHSASVNSYIAIKTNGEVKQKGLYAFKGSKGSPAEKNPKNYVCIDAVIAYLTKGTPLEETIEWCPDVRRFLSVQRVTGGARDTYDQEYLGKVVRFYISRDRRDSYIAYATGKKEGDKVPKSDRARPLMVLDGTLPDDIDYGYYLGESYKMLGELGVL